MLASVGLGVLALEVEGEADEDDAGRPLAADCERVRWVSGGIREHDREKENALVPQSPGMYLG